MHPLALATGQPQIAAPGQMLRIRGLECSGHDASISLTTAAMRQAPHRDHIFDLEGKAQRRTLRQYRQATRPLAIRPVVKRSPMQHDLPSGGFQLAGQSLQQGALARSVRAEHTRHLSRLQVQRNPIQRRDGATPYRQIAAYQHQTRSRSSRNRKNGAPSSAVTMPIGNSAGAITSRAATSASNSRVAPASAEAGKSSR